MKKVVLTSLTAIILTFFSFYIASYIFPYKGFFPYKGVAFNYSKDFISKFANFDGVHYLKISQNGYDQYEQAFFPLYPLLIRFGSIFFLGNNLYAGIFLSNIFLILGSILFYKTLKKEIGEKKAFWTLVFFLFFPTAFFLSAIYTESLFFFIFFASFYFLKRNKFWKSFLFFYLLGLTRVVGVLVVSSLIFLYKNKKNFFYLVTAPILGLLTYMFYLYKTTGDPFFFFHAQPAFGANRSTSLVLIPQVYYRYFKIFFTTSFSFTWFVAFLEFLTFTVILFSLIFYSLHLIKEGKTFSFEMTLIIYSFLSLIVPTFTGTFSSIPRYALSSFSFFIFLARIENNLFKIILLSLFFVLRLVLSFFFAQGYFIS